MCLVQCQSAEQYSFWAWNILTKISHLARWNYDKVPWLHLYYCCSGFRFVSLFRLTFVTLLKSNSPLVPDPAVLVVCAGKCKTGRKQGGNSVRSGSCGSAKGYGTGLKCLRAALQSVCEPRSVLGTLPETQSFGFWFSCVTGAGCCSAGLGGYQRVVVALQGQPADLAQQQRRCGAGRSDLALWLEQG